MGKPLIRSSLLTTDLAKSRTFTSGALLKTQWRQSGWIHRKLASLFELPDGGRRHSQKTALYQVKNSGRSLCPRPNSTGALGDISIIFSKNFSERKTSYGRFLQAWNCLQENFPIYLDQNLLVFFYGSLQQSIYFKIPQVAFNQTLGFWKITPTTFWNKSKKFSVFWFVASRQEIRERLNLKLQFDYHSSFYSSDLKQLGNASAQLVLGGTSK